MAFHMFKQALHAHCGIRKRNTKRKLLLGFVIILVYFVFNTLWKDEDFFGPHSQRLQHSALFSLNSIKHLEVGEANLSITIGAVTCDEPGKSTSSMQASIMIKSVLISAEQYHVSRVEFHLFLEDMEKQKFFESKLAEYGYPNPDKLVKVWMHFHSVFDAVPKMYHQKLIFVETRRCAFVRLFFPSYLRNLEQILYLDTDTIVTGNIVKVWDVFREMTGRKLIGASQNTEEGPDVGVFRSNFGDIPHVPPKGVNSGVLLMNLRKMRAYQWDKKVVEAYDNFSKIYKFQRDQALLNIFLHFHGELLHQFPCNFNYNHIHCEYQTCSPAEKDPDGIHIVHGAGQQFIDRSPNSIRSPLYPVYEGYKNVNMTMASQNVLNALVLPLRKKFQLPHRKAKCYSKLRRLLFKNIAEMATKLS